MDNFIDKIAQRFSSSDTIKANLAAEAKETKRLREKVENYESLLTEMRQISLKNMQSADKIQQLMEGGQTSSADMEGLFAEIGKMNDNFNQKFNEIFDESFRDKLSSNLTAEVGKITEDFSAEVSKISENLSTEVTKLNENLNNEVNKMSENLNSEIGKINENLHTENVKVYRNVQAAVNESLNTQTKQLMAEQQKTAVNLNQAQEIIAKNNKKSTGLIVVNILILLALLANVGLTVMEMFGLTLF